MCIHASLFVFVRVGSRVCVSSLSVCNFMFLARLLFSMLWFKAVISIAIKSLGFTKMFKSYLLSGVLVNVPFECVDMYALLSISSLRLVFKWDGIPIFWCTGSFN